MSDTDATKPALVERDLLIAVIDLPPGEREVYLEKVCGERTDLKERVLQLLRNVEQDNSFMASPAISLGETSVLESLEVGRRVGRYRLMEQIGEGGMGVVFVAEQTEPISRKVALKVIKPGMDSKTVIARFEAERQAVAMMDHPNIARVLDAGTTSDRLPYFVMELVRGMPITQYCDQAKASIEERLRLFQDVCAAVQHAHQKGIIHRDLKPSNILVTLHDGKPVVKVIDFGVAKALHQQLTQHTIYTALNQVLGTPLYMSPEQFELSGLDIDTRSDIYSLGVVLYELIAGTLPFDRDLLFGSSFDEMRRIIREEDPPRPSQKVTTLPKAALSTLAATRGLDDREFQTSIASELDWITLKSLAKDRSRRYGSASEFSADVQRYLDDAPVLACPPSLGYKLKKLVRKHRVLVLSATVLTGSLFIGTGVSIRQAIRAKRAEQEVGERLKEVKSEQAKTRQALTAVQAAESEQRALRQQAENAADTEKQLREETERVARESQWHLYVANLGSMQTALQNNNIGRLLNLLENTRPKEGQIDFRGWEWYYLEQCAKRSFQNLTNTNGEPSTLLVSYNPVRDEIAARYHPTSIDIWDAKSPKLLSRFDCEIEFTNIEWSPDGKYLAIGTRKTNELIVYDSKDRKQVWRTQPFDAQKHDLSYSWIGGLSWNADSQRIAIGTRFGDVAIANLKDKSCSLIHTVEKEDFLEDLAWHPRENRVLIGKRYGRRLIINTEDQTVEDLPKRSDEIGDAVAWSPTGDWVATSEASNIRVSTAAGAEESFLKGHVSSVTDLAWIDERLLLSTSKDHSVRLWDAKTKETLKVWLPSDEPIYSLSLSPSRNHFAVGSDQYVKVIDRFASSANLQRRIQDIESFQDIQWSPDGSRIYAIGFNKKDQIHPGRSVVVDGRSLRTINSGESAFSKGIAWTPDSRFVLRCFSGDQIQVFDSRTSLPIQKKTGIRSKDGIAFWSESCSKFLTHPGRMTPILREGRTGQQIREWPSNLQDGLYAAAWSPSETRVLIGGYGQPALLNIDGTYKQFPDTDSFASQSMAWHPTERIIALGNDRGEIRIRDIETLTPIALLKGHLADVRGLDFSPDGRRLASASFDGTVRIWDVATGRELIQLVAEDCTSFLRVRWSPDGQQLATCTTSNAIVLFGPAGMALAQTKSAIPLHGIVYQHFVKHNEQDRFERRVPPKSWRGALEQISEKLDGLSDPSENTLRGLISEWIEPALRDVDQLESHVTAAIRILDGHLEDQLAIIAGQECIRQLSQESNRIDRRKRSLWLNEVRFAMVHRVANSSDPSTLKTLMKDAIDSEQQYANEFEPSNIDWYRRISLLVLQVQKEFEQYLEQIKASDQNLDREKLQNILVEFRSDMTQVPLDQLPFASAIDTYVTIEKWIEKITFEEILKGHPLSFGEEWLKKLARAIRDSPESYEPYYHVALSQLLLENQTGYTEACQQMLGKLNATSDPIVASFTAWSACLGPSALPDYSQALRLYERLHEKDVVAPQLGALYYRMKNYEQAREELNRVAESTIPEKTSAEYIWCFLAMCEAKLGNQQVAESWAKKANDSIVAQMTLPDVSTRFSWNRIATWRLLQNEMNRTLQELKNE